jgi:hypothetical protein
LKLPADYQGDFLDNLRAQISREFLVPPVG